MDVIELLLKAGANVDAVHGCRSPLSWASDAGHGEVIQVFLRHKPTLKINQADSFGLTPLMEAVRSGHIEVAKLLVSLGADVNLQTKTQSTCLTFAAEKNNLAMVEFLLSCGANIKQRTEAGFTAEQLARMAGFMTISQYLGGKAKGTP